ncbi:MAG: hypothetical protein HQM14_14230 [SAR324 cluster bacterium]|nr:hypothetical protein [SAR324 cluster bacterium]
MEIELSEQLKDMLSEVFHIGVGRAAAALSEMLDQTIEMEVPDLHFFDHDNLLKLSDKLKGNYICVGQRIYGDLEGMGCLSFPVLKGKTLVDNLLNTSIPGSEFGPLEMEAIQEVGNIVVNAVGAAFDNVVGLEIQYDVPEVMLLDSPFLLENQEEDSFYTFANTSLRAKESNVEGFLNMVFAYSSFKVFETIIGTSEEMSKRFGELLLEAHYITGEALEEALALQSKSKQFIGELFIERGYITAEQRDQILESKKYQEQSKKFGEALIAENCITPEQLQEVLETQRLSKSLLGEILVSLGHLNKNSRDEIAAKQKK